MAFVSPFSINKVDTEAYKDGTEPPKVDTEPGKVGTEPPKVASEPGKVDAAAYKVGIDTHFRSFFLTGVFFVWHLFSNKI